jgi:alkaline phosphatase/streptomycin-6-phosphatase
MVDHQVDVILGGGKARFDQPLEDGGTETVADYAESDKGYKLVTDANGLAGVNDIRKPVLGLFNKSNMSLEWNGPDAQTRQADDTYGAPVTCARDQRPANEPSLSDMTTKALSLLEQKGSGKGKGFFCRSRARPSTSATTPRTRASRSVRPSGSTRRSASRSPTSARTPTRSWS